MLNFQTFTRVLLCDIIFAKHRLVPQLVYKCSDQLTDKMSDSDGSFDILRDIKPYSFEPHAKRSKAVLIVMN